MTPAVPILSGALVGLVVGSFLAALVVRWPAGRSVARGRSACDQCGTALRWHNLVPLFSFVAARGRCRSCGGWIDPVHPAVEAAAAVIGAAALAVAPSWQGLAGAVFGWMLLALAVLDFRHLWLPDRLTLPLFVLGLAAGLAGLPPPLLDRAIGAAAGFVALWLVGFVYLRLRGRSGLGGGDPKLLAAVGAWLGWAALPWVVLLAALAGLAAVSVQAVRGRPVGATQPLPLGTLLAAAGFAMWLVSAGSS